MLLKSWFKGSSEVVWVGSFGAWVFDTHLSTLGGVLSVLDDEFIVAGEAFSE